MNEKIPKSAIKAPKPPIKAAEYKLIAGSIDKKNPVANGVVNPAENNNPPKNIGRYSILLKDSIDWLTEGI